MSLGSKRRYCRLVGQVDDNTRLPHLGGVYAQVSLLTKCREAESCSPTYAGCNPVCKQTAPPCARSLQPHVSRLQPYILSQVSLLMLRHEEEAVEHGRALNLASVTAVRQDAKVTARIVVHAGERHTIRITVEHKADADRWFELLTAHSPLLTPHA